MSKLDELIQEFCPDGVEFRKVKDVYIRLKGTPITAGKMKEIANPEGNIKVFAGGKTVIDAMEKDIPKANITRVPAVLVQSRGVIDFVYYDKPFTFKNEMWAYTTDEKISVKFLYYVLKNDVEHFRDAASGMGSLPQISLPVTEEYVFPVPPLEVQREIVRVLDYFTLLTAELTAELTARKKQYEYYRNTLLTRDSNIPIKKIEQLCKVSAGGDAPKGAMSKEKMGEYTIPIISNGVGGNALYGYTNKAKIIEPAVTVAARGTIGYAEYRDYPYFPIIRLLSLIPNDKDELDTKYLYYCLQGKQYNVPTTGIPQLTAPMVKQIEIPVPKLSIQKRIVDVLDNFEKICIDLSIGLPAEINARQKQYEFYRNQLLTFAESGKSILTDRQTDRQSLIKLLQYVFGYVMIPLDDICNSISSGKAKTKGNVGLFPVYGSTGIIARTDDAVYKKDNILVARVGVNAGYTHIAKGEYDVSDNTLIVDVKDEYYMKYVYYLLVNENLNKYAKGGGQPLVTAGQIKKVVISMPNYSEQLRIVEILDRFQALCDDIEIGLPAEIEVRQKQYEYYRDKLLTFKEKE